MSAYVEIIFDNSDRRISTGNDEVIIRRTIGLKKDEYSIDKKSASKSEVMSLLESAGFSRSNPYYIVPQGRITALTNAKDSERLNLLKEVAGTKVYDQRRAESIKVMNETVLKRDKIDESLIVIRGRLEELESEMEELRHYHRKDREKRSLEYTILDREMDNVNMAIDSLEADRAREIEHNTASMEHLNDYDEQISRIEELIYTLNNKINLNKTEKAQNSRDLRDKLKARAQKELECKNLRQNSDNSQETLKQLSKSIRDTTREIEEKKAELESIIPEWQSLSAQESQLKQQVEQLKNIQTFLYRKQGRNQRFSSQAERDSWLHKELENISSSIEQQQEVQAYIETDLKDSEQDLSAITSSIAEIRKTISESSSRSRALMNQKTLAEDALEKLEDERKALWRESAHVEADLGKLNEKVALAQRTAFNSLSRAQSSGLKAVRRLAKKLGLTGVYGTLAELISVEPKFKLATEVTAGNSLFHVVVDNDDTASRLMQELYREQSGRVTFMPLNRLHPKEVQYPQNEAVTPLIDMIDYDEVLDPAVRQVFGKTVVTLNLDVGSQIAHSNNLNAITINGDRVDTKGVLTGGFYDIRRSKLSAFQELRNLHEMVAQKESEYDDLKLQIETKNQEINEAINTTTRVGDEYRDFLRSIETTTAPLHPRVKREGDLKSIISDKRASLLQVQNSIQSLEAELQKFQQELSTPFNQALSAEEISQLEHVKNTLPGLIKALQELSPNKDTIEQRKNELEVEIEQNLQVRLDQSLTRLTSLSNAGSQSGTDSASAAGLAEAERQLQRLVRETEETESEINRLDTEYETLKKRSAEQESELQKIRESRNKHARRVENIHKAMEKNVSKRGYLVTRRDEVLRKIRDIGVIPPDAFTRFKTTSDEVVHKKFKELSEELKQFSHVNKQAVEQYTSFKQQEQKFLERMEELDKARESIETLIETLDMRKDEAIDRTFRQVSRNFTEVFEKLVPAGIGQLVMHYKTGNGTDTNGNNGDDSDVEMDATDIQNSSVENYTGIGISVSFNSKEDDQQRIEQLSGGQKSLCALALIFAIQKSDPAPFYLFDEIDANLDRQYRTAVAGMIQELAKSAQFICTTFRTEILYVAQKFYGVTFKNKMSTIAPITQESAKSFLQGQDKD